MAISKKRIRRTNEELSLEAKKFSSRIEFQQQSNASYKMAWRRGILNKICNHMDILWQEKWNKKLVKKEALKYKTRTEFAKKSPGAYDFCQRNGILDEICAHMGPVSNKPYSFEQIQQKALQFKTKRDLREHDNSVYEAAINMGVLDEVCSHMDALWEIKWDTIEKIKEGALKFNTRGEFKLKSSGAYDAAVRMNVLDLVCSHMKLSRNSSIPEKNLFDIIKNFYPKAQKLVIKKKDLIFGKPHVGGFDIDIYIPELRKGVEFDGSYYNSFEGLKRARPNWPDEDIRNYHKIKDEYFASKGITLLHIKEGDWAENKEKCIEECFQFLGIKNEIAS